MEQDQEPTPSLIQPVIEEFDVSELSAEVNAADAELSDVPFVELDSSNASGDPEEPEQADQPEVEASDDAGEPDDEASGELEDDAEDEEAESEPTEPSADDTTESDEEPEQDEPEPKPGTPDKALQKLQQRQSSFERDINDKLDRLTDLLASSKQAPTEGQDEQPPAEQSTTPAPEASNGEFEAALAELQELAKDNDEFEDTTKADLAKVVGALSTALANLKAPAQQAPEIEGLAEVKQYIEQQQHKQRAEQAWADFESSHGYDGRSVWQQALSDAGRIYPEDGDLELKLSLAQRYFDRRVEKRDAGESDDIEEPKAESKKKKKPVKPVSSKPRKPVTGTQPTPPGARGAGQAKGETKLPPIFKP